MKKLFCLLLACASVALWAESQPAGIEVRHGKGRNSDYRTAVYEALVQAASQVQGVSLQDSRDAFMDESLQLTNTKAGDANVNELRQSLKQSVSAKTKGRVLSYDITSERYDKEMGLWFIELDARIPGAYTLGLPEGNRRRLIVMPFRALTGTVDVFGQRVQMNTTCEQIADRLNEDLTQTRRFTMLDRSFSAQTQAELSRLNLENASAKDFGRFQQLLVTDYMVIGGVRMFSSPSSSYNQYTGTTTQNDGPFIEIAYRVILVPTSQLKWAGTVIVPYSACRGDSVATAIASGFAAAAREVCQDIVDNIYPLRVTAKQTFELVLNQGGKNIREGMVFDVFRQGEEVIDVQSGETLGAPEEQIARIQISRVTPKMSYAVVVEGTPLAEIPVGAVVRRAKMMPGPAAQPGAASPVQVNPNGTVRPPWQK